MKYQLQEKMGPEKAINLELMAYQMNGAATVKTLKSCSAADIRGGARVAKEVDERLNTHSF